MIKKKKRREKSALLPCLTLGTCFAGLHCFLGVKDLWLAWGYKGNRRCSSCRVRRWHCHPSGRPCHVHTLPFRRPSIFWLCVLEARTRHIRPSLDRRRPPNVFVGPAPPRCRFGTSPPIGNVSGKHRVHVVSRLYAAHASPAVACARRSWVSSRHVWLLLYVALRRAHWASMEVCAGIAVVFGVQTPVDGNLQGFRHDVLHHTHWDSTLLVVARERNNN